MKNTDQKSTAAETGIVTKKSHQRKPYTTPVLKSWGDVRGVTLGGTNLIADSSDPRAEGLD